MKLEMSPITFIKKIYSSVKSPLMLPYEICQALGLDQNTFDSFDDFIQQATHPVALGNRVKRFSSREDAELLFDASEKKERFRNQSVYYFYFAKAWLAISLHFDDEHCLRRLYLIHEHIFEERLELKLRS